jgi:hypothetical protein
LVLDNADNKDDFIPNSSGNPSPELEKYIPSCAKGIIVITTRDRDVAIKLADARNVLAKETMDPTDTDALFKYHYPSGAPYQDTSYIQLLEELKRLPLAVTQAASYLEMNHGTMISPSQYLQSFRNTKEDQRQLLSTPTFNKWRSNKDMSETVLTTFSITFCQIQEQLPLAGLILRTIACIDPQAIPHELLFTLNGDEMQLGKAILKL